MPSRLSTLAFRSFNITLLSAFGITPTGTDFAKCANTVQSWVNSSSPILSNSTLFIQDASKPPGCLTIDGCRAICGPGIRTWQVQDIALRFNLWILPAIVLIVHFTFPPLRFYNTAAVITHMIGDPVDSIWSMLMRQESLRRLHQRSLARLEELKANRREMQHIATIWSAYEEIGWVDASDFPKDRPNPQQMKDIKRASVNLSSNRSDARFTAYISVVLLLPALAVAYIKTWKSDTRVQNETAHTIAIVALLFNFIPLVLISGTMGAYTSVSTPIYEIEKLMILKNPLEELLFPPLKLEDAVKYGSNTKAWPIVAPWTGMNSCWRPKKRIDVEASDRGASPGLLCLAACSYTFLLSYAPALFLAMTNHTTNQAIAVGCRALTWSGIAFFWFTSFVFDFVLQNTITKQRTLWRVTVSKDAIISVIIIAGIVMVQIGVVNNCWCRSNPFTIRGKHLVNLFPLSDSEWTRAWKLWLSIPLTCLVCNLLITGFFILRSYRARSLLYRKQEEQDEDMELSSLPDWDINDAAICGFGTEDSWRARW